MPSVVLSSGRVIDSGTLEGVEFYPAGCLNGYGCHFGGPEVRADPFLFLQTDQMTERISGPKAEQDARLLRDVGVRVIVHP